MVRTAGHGDAVTSRDVIARAGASRCAPAGGCPRGSRRVAPVRPRLARSFCGAQVQAAMRNPSSEFLGAPGHRARGAWPNWPSPKRRAISQCASARGRSWMFDAAARLHLLPIWERARSCPCVRVIKRKTLQESWTKYSDAEGPLKAWFAETVVADWASPEDIRAQYRTASIVGDERVVFNIKGNKYRLVVAVNYRAHLVFIMFFGTHAEYNRIDVETVKP
jgi:mRNA interferase HigB